MKAAWFSALSLMSKTPAEKWKHPQTGKWYFDIEIDRGDIHGATKHAFASEQKGNELAWTRYMLDHASKSKQEQVAEGYGRHWGVFGRKIYEETDAFYLVLPDWQWHAFRRAYERLCSPQMRKKGVPFGKAISHRKRARRGTVVTYSRPESLTRLYEWAETLEKPLSSYQKQITTPITKDNLCGPLDIDALPY